MAFDAGSPKGLLYHYTSLEGLLGILEDQKIWATHVRYLNDFSELKNAFEQQHIEHLVRSLLPAIADKVTGEFTAPFLIAEESYDVFVASFTHDEVNERDSNLLPGDRLSQWRAYAGNSSGFSLGFDPRGLMQGLRRSRVNSGHAIASLLRCKYSNAEKMQIAKKIGEGRSKIIDDVLKMYLDEFQRQEKREPDQAEGHMLKSRALSHVLGAAATDYYLQAAGFKSPSFSEEHEWRIACFTVREKLLQEQTASPDDPIIRFRCGRFGMTPYVDFPVDLRSADSPLRRIVVGPGPHSEESVNAVKLLLRSKGVAVRGKNSAEGVEIKRSEIPYRT